MRISGSQAIEPQVFGWLEAQALAMMAPCTHALPSLCAYQGLRDKGARLNAGEPFRHRPVVYFKKKNVLMKEIRILIIEYRRRMKPCFCMPIPCDLRAHAMTRLFSSTGHTEGCSEEPYEQRKSTFLDTKIKWHFPQRWLSYMARGDKVVRASFPRNMYLLITWWG